MRSSRMLPVLVLGVLANSCSSDSEASSQLAVTDAPLATPESVLHDTDADVYLISNIDGSPVAKDGNGFISRVDPENGRVLELKWIAGGKNGVELNAPKGLAFAGPILWVADIDTLRKFDRATGNPLGAVTIPGATFLNDVSCAGDSVFVSDMGVTVENGAFVGTGTDAIWRVGPDGSPEVFHKSAQLKQPNGIVAAADSVYAVSWETGELLRVTRDRVEVLAKTQNQLDGLVQVADGRFFVSSWATGAIYRIIVASNPGAAADIHVVQGKWESPADIGWDQKRQRLLVPLFQANHFVTVGIPKP